jgi:iron complex transport system substrate-binding protein
MTLAMSHQPTTTSSPDLRVISLIASATEILHALGAGATQVARSHECDYPLSVLDLPQLTRAKFKVQGATSAEIDRSVKSLVEQGLAVYEVDAEKMRDLAPDVILTQDQCEVCAVSLADVERALCTWTDSTARLVSLRPHTMDDVYADIGRIAEAIGRPETGHDLVSGMRERIAAISRAVAGRPRPKLGFIEWIEPPMSGGHWMPELIAAAGGISPFGVSGENSPWITWEELAAADPDVVLVAPCGYEIKTSLPELELLRDHPIWSKLRAVREGRAYVADGNAFFNRPGPRLVESAEIMAEVLHPGVCAYGHRGDAYIPLPR